MFYYNEEWCKIWSKISNFIGLFHLKGKLLEPKLLLDVHVLTLKGHEKFGQKQSRRFQISQNKIGEFLSSRREKSSFQILLVCFV